MRNRAGKHTRDSKFASALLCGGETRLYQCNLPALPARFRQSGVPIEKSDAISAVHCGSRFKTVSKAEPAT